MKRLAVSVLAAATLIAGCSTDDHSETAKPIGVASASVADLAQVEVTPISEPFPETLVGRLNTLRNLSRNRGAALREMEVLAVASLANPIVTLRLGAVLWEHRPRNAPLRGGEVVEAGPASPQSNARRHVDAFLHSLTPPLDAVGMVRDDGLLLGIAIRDPASEGDFILPEVPDPVRAPRPISLATAARSIRAWRYDPVSGNACAGPSYPSDLEALLAFFEAGRGQRPRAEPRATGDTAFTIGRDTPAAAPAAFGSNRPTAKQVVVLETGTGRFLGPRFTQRSRVEEIVHQVARPGTGHGMLVYPAGFPDHPTGCPLLPAGDPLLIIPPGVVDGLVLDKAGEAYRVDATWAPLSGDEQLAPVIDRALALWAANEMTSYRYTWSWSYHGNSRIDDVTVDASGEAHVCGDTLGGFPAPGTIEDVLAHVRLSAAANDLVILNTDPEDGHPTSLTTEPAIGGGGAQARISLTDLRAWEGPPPACKE